MDKEKTSGQQDGVELERNLDMSDPGSAQNMRSAKEAHLRELFFRISVWLKGLDGVAEIVGGIALWAVSPEWIVRVVRILTQDEIVEDPHDFVANHLRHAASQFSLSGEHFMAIYLLGHGIVKILVVAALLRNKLWAYPAAIIAFGGFVVYQIYRFTLTGGVSLIALTLFDMVVIWLIWLEYRALKSARTRIEAA